MTIDVKFYELVEHNAVYQNSKDFTHSKMTVFWSFSSFMQMSLPLLASYIYFIRSNEFTI